MGSLSPVSILDAGLKGLMGVIGTAVPAVSLAKQLTSDIRDIRNDPAEQAAEQAAQTLAAQQQLAMAQMTEQQRIHELQAAQDAAQSRQEIAADAATAEQSRRAALKRAVARQKVSLASQGISSADDGSAEAILLGMFQESEDERGTRARLDGLREQAIGQGLVQTQALNVLQRTQLADRQRLERELRG